MNKLLILIFAFISLSVNANSQYSEPMIDLQDQELVDKFVAFANDYDGKGVETLMDIGVFAARVSDSMGIPRRSRQSFIKGYTQSVRHRLGDQLLFDLKQAYGQTLHAYNVTYKEITGPMIRFDLGEQGINYFILVIEKNKYGKSKIVDYYAATQDALFSNLLGTIGQMMTSPNKSMLARIFGKDVMDKNVLATMKSVGVAKQQGDYLKAYKRLKTLPDKIRNHKLLLSIGAQLAASVNDNLYYSELKLLAKYYKNDPSAAFSLVDYYIFEEDYSSAITVIENFEKNFKEDGQTALLKASISYSKQDFLNAKSYARRCTELEEYKVDCRWLIVNSSIEDQDYKEAILGLDILKSKFHIDFVLADFQADDFYSGLVESEEFKSWLNISL